jgi:flagellar L-ring protein precursor FlgH
MLTRAFAPISSLTRLAFLTRLALVGGVLLSLSACNTFTRLSELGNGPQLSEIQNPYARQNYTPVSLPMPTAQPAERNPNSLWRTGARAFFKDQRAAQVGDLLTVKIKINDKAELDNETTRSRNSSENAGLSNFFGFETGTDGATGSGLENVLTGVVPSKLLGATGTSSTRGDGSVKRNESINLQVAAIVTEILPNGNLVIEGRQEVRVNFELRDLRIKGVIRPEDVSARNEISYEKIAEARIYYGGRGVVADVQKPRWGQEAWDIIFPW